MEIAPRHCSVDPGLVKQRSEFGMFQHVKTFRVRTFEHV